MNRKLLLIPLILIFTLIAAGSAAAQEDVSVDASIAVVPGEFTVGDPISLELVVNHPADSHVILPDMETEWGSFIVQSQSAPNSITNANGSKTTTQTMDVRLFAPGEFLTPAVPITVATSDGQLVDVIVDPIPVSITSILVEGDEALRDIKPQAELPYLTILPWAITAVVLALVAIVVIWLVRRRRTAAAAPWIDPRLPHEVALERLDRIENLGLPNEGRYKEHYTMLSDCVRIYVERAFHIPVMERTTSEIQKDIKRTTITSAISRQFLSLLDESDLVKFSEFTPDVISARQALQLGRLIVVETTPMVEPDSISGSSGSAVKTVGDVSDTTASLNGNMRQKEVRA